MLCKKCGNKVENPAKVCNKCGNILVPRNKKNPRTALNPPKKEHHNNIIQNNIDKKIEQDNLKLAKVKTKSNKYITIAMVITRITQILIFSCFCYVYVNMLGRNVGNQLIKVTRGEAIIKTSKAIESTRSHYDHSVITTKDANLLDDDGNIVGIIYKGNDINLNDIQIDQNTKYFSIENLDYKIDYNSVTPNKNTSNASKLSKESRYKNYIPYNTNLVTKDNYSLYYEGNKVYTFNRSATYPVIINNYEDYYYVEFDDKLYSIYKDDIKEFVYSKNSAKKNKNYITTLCYHRIYKDEGCNSAAVCIKQEKFDTQMKYLKDNNYFTLTTEEMYMYIKGNVQIEKGVLITLDDGWLLQAALEVFDKYDLNGVSFTGTNRIEDKSFSLEKTYNSENIEIQSHTHDLHKNGVCPKYLSKINHSQGGALLCENEEYIANDLKKSVAIINNMGKNKAIALAYPFYDFNDRAISLLREVGLKLAFTGAYNKAGRAVVGNDPYMIPRMPIREKTSFNTWKSYL